jgi:hypothetical protein
VRAASRSWLESQPEIDSLKKTGIPNSLGSLFGLTSDMPSRAVAAILDAVVSSIDLRVGRANKYLKTNIELVFQRADFVNLLSLPEGFVITEKGEDLHWLDWLLTKGDTIIISGYTYKAETGRGRSGGGFMKEGGAFRVPPEYSGTLENNFVVRAFEGREKEINAILSELLQ